MIRKFDNKYIGPNGVLGQLAADKKKAAIAVGLIVVMFFMWIKVLRSKGPQAAQAAPRISGAGSTDTGSNTQMKMTFIKLPEIKGRHDVLIRDFFEIDERIFSGSPEVNIISEDGSESLLRSVAERLKLEAISLSERPEAFINDQLVTIGQKLIIKDGAKTYECKIVGIEEDTVFVRYGQSIIKLKLKQANEVTD